ncbi:MAG: acetate/propionate family kinase [Chloroflexi bacterium]|nr:acetate/propionate family kinase [Chloroflexota bacterium]
MSKSSEGSTILVLNAGSTSLKVTVFSSDASEEIAHTERNWAESGAVDRSDTHAVALGQILGELDSKSIRAVGHRIVYGGGRFIAPVILSDAVIRGLESLTPLAPLHNPPAIAAIRAARQHIPIAPQVVAFDTAFHATLPRDAFLYGVPFQWFTKWGMRRFGFHGLSFSYCTRRAAEILRRPLEQLRLVICHLGGGCSLAAVRSGRSVDTTMGYTPMDGLVMATRSGSVDPGLILAALREHGVSAQQLEEMLETRSGLYGLSGTTGDMRELLERRLQHDEDAERAIGVFVWRLRAGIAAMAAATEGIDAIVFTGGIGEHAKAIREQVCISLSWLGIHLDQQRNDAAKADTIVSTSDSEVAVLVIHTREDLEVALAVLAALEHQGSSVS